MKARQASDEQPRMRGAWLFSPSVAAYLPWLVAVITMVALWAITPAVAAIPIENGDYWRNGFHWLERNEEGNFRWTEDRARLVLPARSIGPQRLVMRLQSGQPRAVPIEVYAQQDRLAFTVARESRQYQVLVPGTFQLQHPRMTITAPTMRLPGETRDLGIVARGAILYPVAGSLPWWLVTAGLLLGHLAVIQFVLLRRFPAWLRVILATLFFPVLAPWLHTQGTDAPGFVTALQSTLGLALLCALVYLAPPLLRSLLALSYVGLSYALRLLQRIRVVFKPLSIRPWNRNALAVGLAFVGGTILVRILFLPDYMLKWSGDDYLVGVFALNILHGDLPLYFSGRTGTLSAYLIAPLIGLLGPSSPVLAVLPLALTAVLTFALYGLGRDLFGPWGGLAAASWMLLPSATALYWSTKPQPGYLEMLTFGTLMLWGLLRLLWGDHPRAQQILLAAAVGVATACAIWASFVVAAFIITCALAVLLARQRWRRLPRLSLLLLFGLPLLLWLGPLLLQIRLHPDKHPFAWALSSEHGTPNLFNALRGFVMYQVPLLLSGDLALATPLDYALMVSILAALAVMARFAVRGSQAALLVWTLALATVAVFAVSPFGYVVRDVRYVLPLIIAIPLVLAGVIAAISRTRAGTRWAGSALVGVLLLNALTLIGQARPTLAYTARNEAAVAAYLQQSNIEYAYASFWIAQPLIFESGGRIAVSAAIGPTRVSYDPRNEARVAAAQGRATAFIFKVQGIGRPAFERYLKEAGISCERARIDKLMVYQACVPFPLMENLIQKLPIAME